MTTNTSDRERDRILDLHLWTRSNVNYEVNGTLKCKAKIHEGFGLIDAYLVILRGQGNDYLVEEWRRQWSSCKGNAMGHKGFVEVVG